MARFDVYPNQGPHSKTIPYLLDVQSNLLDDLDTRMVIPLRTLEDFQGVKLPTHLTPVFQINGSDYMLETPKMAAVPRQLLKATVTSLLDEQSRITGALDFLFNGY